MSDKLKEMRAERRQVRYLHDNPRLHVAKVTREKLLQLEWKVLVHSPYSPDISPSDYHLFRSLSIFLHGRQFSEEVEAKAMPINFLDSKPQDFCKRGIESLHDRWKQLVNSESEYIVD